jgi:hypothetical protein
VEKVKRKERGNENAERLNHMELPRGLEDGMSSGEFLKCFRRRGERRGEEGVEEKMEKENAFYVKIPRKSRWPEKDR